MKLKVNNEQMLCHLVLLKHSYPLYIDRKYFPMCEPLSFDIFPRSKLKSRMNIC